MLTTVAEDGAGQLQLSLFGVPVRVDVSFLILVFVVAVPVLGEGPGYAAGLAVIVFTSILGHELGHAAAIQALVEPNPSIVLYGLGGLTRHARAASRPRSLLVSLAGPAAGLSVGAAAWIAGRTAGGRAEDVGAVGWELAIFWTIANLLPVLPLDGGQALESALPGTKAVRQRVVQGISVVTCAAGGLLAWSWDEPILVAFAAWFGLTNLAELRSSVRHKSTADDLRDLQAGFAELRPATAAALEAQARHAVARAPEDSRAYAGSVLIASLLVQDEYDQAKDLIRGLGPEGCAHGLAQLVDLGADAGEVLEGRLRSQSSAYDATLYLLDRSLHHDWERAATLVEQRPPESFEAAWLELSTTWAFHAGAFEAAQRLGRVLEGRVNGPAASYNVACSAARAGDVSGAITALGRAVERGWNDLAQLDTDEDLAALRSTAEWERLRRRVRDNGHAGAPSSRRWGAAAGLVAVLAVTGLSVRLASVDDEPSATVPDAGLDVTTELIARDPTTGRELWRHSGGSSIFPSWVDDDLVILQDVDAETRALDARTGEEQWSAEASGFPLVGQGVVVLNEEGDGEEGETGDGLGPMVTVLDRTTGEVLWSRRDTRAVTISGDVVILDPATSNEVVGVDAATGSERWSAPGAVAGVPEVGVSPLVVKDAEQLSGLDPRTGVTHWTMTGDLVGTSSTAAWVRRAGDPRVQRVQLATGTAAPVSGVADVESLVGEDGGVVILSTASRLWGVDERSGVVRWEREADVLVATAVGDGLALETSTDEVIAFDVLTGEVRWQADVDEVVYAQPEAGVVVAATPVGSVVLDVATGEELWSLGEQVVAILGGDDLMVSVQVR